MMWNAVVLAGDCDPDNPVARASLTPHKAAAMVGAKRLIDFPLAALAAMMDEGRIGRIIIAAAPGAPATASGPWDEIEAGDTITESLQRAYDAVGGPLLVTTCDAAMLTPDILRDFLDASENGIELSAGISPLEVIEPTPEAPPRDGFALAEGRYATANLFAIASADPTPTFAALSKMERGRVPAEILLSAIAWRLRTPTRAAVEAKATKVLGLPAQLVELSQPEAGFDVNTALDLMHFRCRWADWLALQDSAA